MRNSVSACMVLSALVALAACSSSPPPQTTQVIVQPRPQVATATLAPMPPPHSELVSPSSAVGRADGVAARSLAAHRRRGQPLVLAGRPACFRADRGQHLGVGKLAAAGGWRLDVGGGPLGVTLPYRPRAARTARGRCRRLTAATPERQDTGQ